MQIKRLVKVSASLVAVALVLTGCNRENYSVTLRADETVKGSVSNVLTFERYQMLKTPQISTPRPILGLTYNFDAVNCILNGVSISVLSMPTVIEGDLLTVANAQFANQLLTFSGNVASISAGNINLADGISIYGDGSCPGNPGLYQSAGRIYLGYAPWWTLLNGFNRPDWDAVETNLAVRNISPTDLPYYFALSELGTSVAINASTLLTNLFRSSVFDSLPDRPWANGEFVAALNGAGIKTAIDAYGWKVTLPLEEHPLATLQGTSGQVATIFPGFSQDSDGAWVLSLDYSVYKDGLQNDPPADQNYPDTPSDESQFLDKQAKDLAWFRHSFVVQGLVFRTDGVFNAKKNSVYFDWKGWGTHATKTSLNPRLEVVLGTKISFKAGKNTLTTAAKNALKKAKTALKAMPGVTIWMVQDGRITNASKLTKHTQLLTKRANAIKAYLVSLGVSTTITIINKPTENNSSALTKANVDKAVVGKTYVVMP